MQFRVLGLLEALEGDRLVPLGAPRRKAVLALLLLHANEPLSAERIVDALWPAGPPETAAKVVQNAVSGLRKALGRERIETQGSSYVLRLADGELDAAAFERLVAAGRAAGGPGETATLLREADALWRGPALADFAYEEFARPHAFRLEELRLAATEDRVDAELALGRHAELVGELRALVDTSPLRERLRGQLMLALYRAGRQAEALQAYREARRALVDELGIEPSAALQELEKAILVHDASLDVRPAAPPRVPTRAADVRKPVTAVSISLAARGDPEAVARAFERTVDAAAAVLARHEATLERRAGDVLVAVFGVPQVHEDDALRAARAAAETRDALAAVVPAVASETGVEVAAAIGVESGEIVGDDAAAPAGAARRLAAAGEVRVGPAAAALLRGAATLDGGTLVAVSEEADAIPRRLDAPLVGRAHELERLREAFDRVVAQGTCQLVTVLGPAGVGKTRLGAELRALVERDATVLVGRCPPYGAGRTLRPVVELVRAAAGGIGRDDVAALLAGRSDAGAIADIVAGALGAGEGAAATAETFWALRKLFETLAATRPLVLVLDDLHWAEPTLLDLVDQLAELALGAPILLVCLARPELLDERPGWGGGKLNAATVLLEPLDEGDADRLVGGLLGRARLPEEARLFVAEAGGGNPLFIEQLLSMLIEEGALRRRRGGWEATPDLTRRRVPPTIQALLAARLDRLDATEREALQAAAVAGGDLWVAAVAELLGLAPLEASARLDALVRKDLLRPTASLLPGQDALRFRHVLIREAAYDSIPKRARAELHAAFGEWLARAGGDDEAVGFQLEAAHRNRLEAGLGADDALAARATERLVAAARHAANFEDVPAAVRLHERALGLLREDDPQRPALVVALADLTLYAAPARTLELAELALAEALTSGDLLLEWRSRIARLRALQHVAPSPVATLLAECEAAVSALETLGDDASLAKAYALLSAPLWFRGDIAATEQAARRSIEHARRAGDLLTAARSVRTLLGCALLGPMPVSEGCELARVLQAEHEARPLTLAAALRAEAGLRAMAGDHAQARALIERDRAIGRELGLRMFPFYVAQVATLIELLAGDAAAAEREARVGVETAQAVDDNAALGELAGLHARALAACGRDEEALAQTQLAESVAADGDVVNENLWRAVRAEVLARRGDADVAERLAREAVDAADRTDLLPFRGDLHASLAVVLEHAGRDDEAADERLRARALYEAKGASAAAARLGAPVAGATSSGPS